MIAAVNYADEGQTSGLGRGNPRRIRRDSDHLQTRNRQFPAQEIAFIPNSSFRHAQDRDETAEPPAIEEIENGQNDVPAISPVVGLPAHLMRMCRTPLLTAEEEAALFRRMNFLKYRANVLRSDLKADQTERDKLGEIQNLLVRAGRIRNHVIQSNVRLVMSIAKTFADANNAFDDLLSEGITSLMHAVEKFDYDRGYRFSTYATRAIRRDLYRLVIRSQKQRQRFATGTDDYFAACPDEPGKHGVSEEQAGATYSRIEEMLENLDPRERMIVRARFGFDSDGARKVTFTTLAKQLGISKERVRQLCERALSKLRVMVPEFGLEALSA